MPLFAFPVSSLEGLAALPACPLWSLELEAALPVFDDGVAWFWSDVALPLCDVLLGCWALGELLEFWSELDVDCATAIPAQISANAAK